jgi:trk system potassium uptake protein TrkH
MEDVDIRRGDSGRFLPPPVGPRAAWMLRAAEALATILAALCVPVRWGFVHTPASAAALFGLETALALFFSTRTVAAFFRYRHARLFFQERGGELAILGLTGLVLGFLWAAEGRMPNWGYVEAVLEIYLGMNVVLALARLERAVLRLRIRPLHVFVLSFAAIILTGAALLCLLPRATRAPGTLSFLDALFTATSATCVTGLAVVDTGSTFTRLGQTIVVVLIQSGGLGIMIFAAFVGLALGKGMGLREREMMKSSLNLEFAGDMGRVVLFILLATFGIEAAGALLIFGLGTGEGHPEGTVWFSIFNAVSAFCNAGFALDPDSYERQAANAPFLAVIMTLIFLGGLGFSVIRDFRALPGLLPRFARHSLVRWRLLPEGPPPRMSLHSRIALTVSILLVMAGAMGFLGLERGGVLHDAPFEQAALASLFQSVSARTCGFNSIPFGALATPTLLLVMVLMAIGGSPGSTGGGIKTTTFAILLLDVYRTFRGRRDVEVRGRRIPAGLVDRALVLAFVFAGIAGAGIFLLAVFEPRMPLQRVAFEAVSALATVGLSTGITPELSAPSKVLVILLMFIGRMGPMTLVWALGTETAKARYSYPEERLVIG